MPHREPEDERRSFSVIGAFYDVYNELRYGLLEQLYLAALQIELVERGHVVAREVSVPAFYKGHPIGVQRLDLVVDDCLVIEAKATVVLSAIARRQLHSYLHATRLDHGLLLHFGPEAAYEHVRRWES